MQAHSNPVQALLIVEDNRDIAGLVALHLRDAGYAVRLAHDGREGLCCAQATAFDLILLDLMLPGIDGIDICRQLRQQQNNTPILMLTARSTEVDRVLGLNVGADDYLTKPFSIHELLARVKAILRRVQVSRDNLHLETSRDDNLRVGEIEINRQGRSVKKAGTLIDLTVREFELLLHFAVHPGRVYSRAQLLDNVWGHGHDGYEHTVNSHINRLRAKIEPDPANPRYILTVWGVGYKFTEAVAAS
ncbi:MAG: response regulator transcription factor [Gammaproteobacteria bacterium]|nr:response regulator transcription factor [Gammaproteobacteria bacterium]